MSFNLLTATALFGLAANACSDDVCRIQVCEHTNLNGWCKDFAEGQYSSLGWWNDRISCIRIFGGPKCLVTIYEHNNFQGRSQQLRAWNNIGGSGDQILVNLNGQFMNDRISSIRVQKTGRRRQEEANLELEVHDPLCEWILQDGLDSDWAVFTPEKRNQEVSKLVTECEENFEDEEKRLQCLFYVYAIAEVFGDAELLKTLRFDPKEETIETEYMHCGMITNMLNDAIEAGNVSGVKVVKGEDGEPDHFDLMEPTEFETTALEMTKNSAALEALLSVGSMIALAIGHTMVKLCRDFDAAGHFLL